MFTVMDTLLNTPFGDPVAVHMGRDIAIMGGLGVQSAQRVAEPAYWYRGQMHFPCGQNASRLCLRTLSQGRSQWSGPVGWFGWRP